MSVMCSIPVLADPKHSRSPRIRTAPEPRRVERELIEAEAAGIEIATGVTAALCWRGGCVLVHTGVVAPQCSCISRDPI
jgi:hypothetical protein